MDAAGVIAPAVIREGYDTPSHLKDGVAWLCRLAHISTTDYKWLLAEAAKPATKVTEEEVAMYDEHLRSLYVELENTLLTN